MTGVSHSVLASYGGGTITVVLDNQSITKGTSSSGSAAHAGVAFDSDGKLYEVGPGLLDRTEIVGNWVDNPTAGIGSSYDVRCASISVGSWGTAAAGTGTWIQISTERVWRVSVIAKNSPDTKSCVAVFEIRPTGSGSAIDSGQVSATAQN